MRSEALSRRLDAVRARIRAAAERGGRDPAFVRLVAVAKGVDAGTVRALVALGVVDIGESRVQEAASKIPAVGRDAARWHLVGHLQRNKVGRALELFDVIQSVDSLALAEALERRAALGARVVPVLLEVNIAGEPQKRGFAPDAVLEAAGRAKAWRWVRVEGLMTVAPLVDDPEAVRPVFRGLRALAERVRLALPDAGKLSMGMSNDFEVAVEEGATIVRIGRALFAEQA